MKILEVKNMSVSINKESRLKDGSFEINEGNVVLLTGANGCGKSTIIKILMGDTMDFRGLEFRGKAVFHMNSEVHDIISSQDENDIFRRNVCYVSQDDTFEYPSVMDCFESSLKYADIPDKKQYIFDFVKKFSIADMFYQSSDNIKLNSKCRSLMRKLGISGKNISDADKRAVSFLSLNPNKLSGGQKKWVNIFSSIVNYENNRLIILDEPLNNLDYSNVRAFSNILTRIYKEKSSLGILIVTHCRSIPIINKVIEIDAKSKSLKSGDDFRCSSCFGEIDNNGYYV